MKKYVVANWKENMDLSETRRWFDEFDDGDFLNLTHSPELNVVLAPSYPFLPEVSILSKKRNMYVSAQNISLFESGAHTGEVGATQIIEFCKYCIVGHSEIGDPTEVVIEKRDICLSHGIIPIVCFSDPDRIIEYEKDGSVLAWEDSKNISNAGNYKELNANAIGDLIDGMKSKLKDTLPLLYGGSVNRQNIHGLSAINGLDGFLVGNASLSAGHFFDIVRKIAVLNEQPQN